jgi:peptidoglycan biosynthesis protein MviN/MurJ (putative lipid II flippase)
MIKRYLAKRENPWELLLLGFSLFLPGIALLVVGKPIILLSSGRGAWTAHATMLTAPAARLFGGLVAGLGVLVVWLYFYALKYELPEEIPPPHHSEKPHDHLTRR